jgi:hypothetical protein
MPFFGLANAEGLVGSWRGSIASSCGTTPPSGSQQGSHAAIASCRSFAVRTVAAGVARCLSRDGTHRKPASASLHGPRAQAGLGEDLRYRTSAARSASPADSNEASSKRGAGKARRDAARPGVVRRRGDDKSRGGPGFLRCRSPPYIVRCIGDLLVAGTGESQLPITGPRGQKPRRTRTYVKQPNQRWSEVATSCELCPQQAALRPVQAGRKRSRATGALEGASTLTH